VRAGTGRRAGQRFDAQHGVVTEALVFLGDLDPDAVGPSIALATHYEPTPLADFDRLVAAASLAPQRTTFVDVGSGMGRVVMLASRLPFKQVVGIEISPALHAIARENLAAFDPSLRRCRDIRLVRGDALSWRLPRGDLAVYLFNPFRAEGIEQMLARVLSTRRSEVTVLYHTPVERAAIELTDAFEIVADLGFGVVYRLKNRAATTSSSTSSDRR
jgi:SAM-dependent methyltransferase